MEKHKIKDNQIKLAETKPQLALVKNPSSFDLIIPEEVEAKIRHLCSRVHDVEWSGTLFYTVEGSLDDGTFKATCVDICVMDIGTKGETIFKDTPDIINYRLEHGLLREGVYEALIHSHGTFSAYFSGTDVNTLLKEGSDLNHFLSLIVCNAGQYVARITRKLKKKIKAEALITYTESTEYKTFENVNIILSEGAQRQETKVEEKEVTYVEFFEMRINKTEVPEPFKELDERLDEIKRNKFKIKYSNYEKYDESPQPINKPILLNQEIENPNQTELVFEGQEEVKEKFDFNPASVNSESNAPEFYWFEKVPFEIVRTLCVQLLTGSILATSRTSLNLNDWVNKMDELYEVRFGTLTDSYNKYRLQNWIQSFIDEILCYSVDKHYEDELAERYNLGIDYDYNDSDAFVHLYACDMIDYLEDLPKSIVKKMMIEELINLMPAEYENFRDNH